MRPTIIADHQGSEAEARRSKDSGVGKGSITVRPISASSWWATARGAARDRSLHGHVNEALILPLAGRITAKLNGKLGYIPFGCTACHLRCTDQAQGDAGSDGLERVHISAHRGAWKLKKHARAEPLEACQPQRRGE